MGSYVKTEQFLDLYKRLEKTGRKHFPRMPENAPIINKLCELPTLRPYKDDIEYCRTVRNFLVHTPKIKNMYPVIPSDEMIELLNTCLEKLENPLKAMDYAVKFKNMYTATLEDKISDITDFMNKSGFTHVPVINKQKKLIGVFSDNVLYSFVCKHGTINVNTDTKVEALIDFLPIHAHLNEYFAFVKDDVDLEEVADLFTIDVKSMKQLSGIFFTENGRADEAIHGMMTPYSLLRDYKEILKK